MEFEDVFVKRRINLRGRGLFRVRLRGIRARRRASSGLLLPPGAIRRVRILFWLVLPVLTIQRAEDGPIFGKDRDFIGLVAAIASELQEFVAGVVIIFLKGSEIGSRTEMLLETNGYCRWP